MSALTAFLLLFVLFQAVPPRDTGRPRAAADTASVSGRVYSAATGAPIRGALVAVTPSPLPERSSARVRFEGAKTIVPTDAQGRFTVSGVAPGSYYVIAVPSTASERYLPAGYGAAHANDPGTVIVIADGADVRNVDIALRHALAIEGRVVDESGEAVSRALIFAGRYAPGSDIPQRVGGFMIQTDDLGRYRLFGLEPGAYVVAADARTGVAFFESTERSVVARGTDDAEPFAVTFHPSTLNESTAQRVRLSGEDVSGIDITLLRSRRLQISGMIVDSRGQPAVFTSAALIRRGLSGFDTRQFQTDPLGEFRTVTVEPGEYRLVVGSGLTSGSGAVNGRTEFADMPFTIASDMTNVVVSTQPGILLSGQVVFAETPPAKAPPMTIALRRPEGSVIRGDGIETTMDDALRFSAGDVFGPLLIRVSGLPAGWTVKAVTLAGADITDVPTAFTADHQDRLHVVLSSHVGTLEGNVRFDGSAGGSAVVYVFAEDRTAWRISSPRTRSVDVGEHGQFRVGDLAAGRYYAVAIARQGFRLPPQPGEAFFELLSKVGTPFTVGEDERRPLELKALRWPE